jgi:putative endonuclease
VVYLYILRSLKTGNFYVGHAEDIERRLLEHNSGRSRSTKSRAPWVLVLSEGFESRSEAMAKESLIKSWKSPKAVQQLIDEMPSEERPDESGRSGVRAP